MKLEDQRLLWMDWVKSYKVHRLDFIEWINLQGYHVESYLIGEDAEEQGENLGHKIKED